MYLFGITRKNLVLQDILNLDSDWLKFQLIKIELQAQNFSEKSS
jgi:hypothetical protein